MDELEIMRQQLVSMKSQLDTQEIINKELMRKVMRGKASWMNVIVKMEFVLLPLIFLCLMGICYLCGISQWFSFSFLIIGGVDAVLDVRTVRIPNHLFSSASIVDLKKFLVRQKKERFIQTCFGSLLGVIWFILFIGEVNFSTGSAYHNQALADATNGAGVTGGIIGAIISLIVIIVLYRKMQRTNDQIIADIDGLEYTDTEVKNE